MSVITTKNFAAVNDQFRSAASEFVKWKSSRQPFGFIYIIAANGAFKVGFTRNVERRAGQYSTYLHRGFAFILCEYVKDPVACESRIKREFAGKRLSGEWFRLTGLDIEDIRAIVSEFESATH